MPLDGLSTFICSRVLLLLSLYVRAVQPIGMCIQRVAYIVGTLTKQGGAGGNSPLNSVELLCWEAGVSSCLWHYLHHTGYIILHLRVWGNPNFTHPPSCMFRHAPFVLE